MDYEYSKHIKFGLHTFCEQHGLSVEVTCPYSLVCETNFYFVPVSFGTINPHPSKNSTIVVNPVEVLRI